jgi:hypothetical protein
MNWTEYNSTTGQMGGVHSGYQDAESVLSQIFMTGMDAAVEGEYDNRTHYILNGEPTERPTQSTTLDGRSLTGLPVPATLHIDGETYTVDNGEAELEFPLPGTYRLRVEAWPFKDWEGEVTVPVLSGAEA